MDFKEFIQAPDGKRLAVIDIVKEDCQWTEIVLANGDKIRARVVPMQVLWDGETRNPDGTAAYQVNWNVMCVVRQV